MVHEFSRTELLIEKEGLERLRNATVMVLGVGGVGSHCIEALARCGVGTLILVDNDKVSKTAINTLNVAVFSPFFFALFECYNMYMHDLIHTF